MRIRFVIALVLGTSLTLGACERETVGTLGGAAAGGLLGSQIGSGSGQTIAIIAGTLAGAYLGRRVAQSSLFSDEDAKTAANAERQALASGSPAVWSSADNPVAGRVTPVQTFEREGRVCREYTHSITTPTDQETLRGTACRQPDGTWQLAS